MGPMVGRAVTVLIEPSNAAHKVTEDDDDEDDDDEDDDEDDADHQVGASDKAGADRGAHSSCEQGTHH